MSRSRKGVNSGKRIGRAPPEEEHSKPQLPSVRSGDPCAPGGVESRRPMLSQFRPGPGRQLRRRESKKLYTIVALWTPGRDFPESLPEPCLACFPGSLSKVVLSLKRGKLLRNCQSYHLIDRDIVSLRYFLHFLVQRVRKPNADCAHASTPICCNNTFGVITFTPNWFAPLKSTTLNVTIESAFELTASSCGFPATSKVSSAAGRHNAPWLCSAILNLRSPVTQCRRIPGTSV